MNRTTKSGRRGRGQAMTASKRFGRYKKEIGKDVRIPEIAQLTEDRTIAAIVEAWSAADITSLDEAGKARDAIEQKVGRYTAEDVMRFCFILRELQDKQWFPAKACVFLSALINSSPEREFTILTDAVYDLMKLGFMNEKNITFEGDVGADVGAYMVGGNILVRGDALSGIGSHMLGGHIAVEGNGGSHVSSRMKDGSVVIKGDASSSLGYGMEGGEVIVLGNSGEFAGLSMKGGFLRIEGNVADALGIGMHGGEIEVLGNAGAGTGTKMRGGIISIFGDSGNQLGKDMQGGEIHVQGAIGSIGEIEGGRIYHKGKLIVDK